MACLTVTCIELLMSAWHDDTKNAPSYVRSSHSVWHIPSHLWHVTLIRRPIRGQHPCHVTWGQPIRGGGVTRASALPGEWSMWSLIRLTMILCVNQGSGDSLNSQRGTGTFAHHSDQAQFQEFLYKKYSEKKIMKSPNFAWLTFPFQLICSPPHGQPVAPNSPLQQNKSISNKETRLWSKNFQ